MTDTTQEATPSADTREGGYAYHWIITLQYRNKHGLAAATQDGTLGTTYTTRGDALKAVIGSVKKALRIAADAQVVILFFALEPNRLPAPVQVASSDGD
jgi:hypothetical protein